MIRLYFGLPGAGKTTLMAKLAIDALNAKVFSNGKLVPKYNHVYCNVHTTIPGVTYIDNECIGQYELRDCLILVDEATLFADSRDWKNFSGNRLEYFLTHRHYRADIFLFSQQWDAVDRKIRCITDRVYYIYKGFFTRPWLSKCYRIPYGIIIPDGKKTGNTERLGEIIQGYRKPPVFVRVFAQIVYRPKYYKYFDSFETKPLPPLPPKYRPFTHAPMFDDE